MTFDNNVDTNIEMNDLNNQYPAVNSVDIGCCQEQDIDLDQIEDAIDMLDIEDTTSCDGSVISEEDDPVSVADLEIPDTNEERGNVIDDIINPLPIGDQRKMAYSFYYFKYNQLYNTNTMNYALANTLHMLISNPSAMSQIVGQCDAFVNIVPISQGGRNTGEIAVFGVHGKNRVDIRNGVQIAVGTITMRDDGKYYFVFASGAYISCASIEADNLNPNMDTIYTAKIQLGPVISNQYPNANVSAYSNTRLMAADLSVANEHSINVYNIARGQVQ